MLNRPSFLHFVFVWRGQLGGVFVDRQSRHGKPVAIAFGCLQFDCGNLLSCSACVFRRRFQLFALLTFGMGQYFLSGIFRNRAGISVVLPGNPGNWTDPGGFVYQFRADQRDSAGIFIFGGAGNHILIDRYAFSFIGSVSDQ